MTKRREKESGQLKEVEVPEKKANSGQRKIGREWPEENRQRVAIKKEAESGHRKRFREWPVEKRQRVATEKESESGQ